MKKLMILGASYSKLPLYEAAERLGIKTIAASTPGDWPGFQAADESTYTDISDPGAVMEAARKFQADGITTCCLDTGAVSYTHLDGMQVAFDAAQVELRVKKTKEDLGDLKEKNIKASIDLKDKKEGTYEVVVDIEIPEGYELVDEVKTQIEVSRISKAEENS